MGFQLNTIPKKELESSKKNSISSLLQKEIVLFGAVLSNKFKEDFYTELSILLKAGITLKDGLELILEATHKKARREQLETVLHTIVSGASLSEAIKDLKSFSDYEYYSLKIGEETGTLFLVTEQLGAFYARKNEQRRDLISALTYPFIILMTAILVVIFMLQFVVPMFQDIFKQQQVELPGITKFIIKMSELMKSYGWVVLILIIAGFLLRITFTKKAWFQKSKDTFVSKLPFVGQFVSTIYLSQFTQAMSLLMMSKVPLVNSIQLVKQMIRFYPLQSALEKIEQNILKGESLSSSLKNHKLFDDKMIALVKVAEETNQNEFIFERLNQQYNTQVKQRSKLLSTIMEPLIILIIGLLVGLILIAMYLPMFKLSSVMG